jgi:hypothetical protein
MRTADDVSEFIRGLQASMLERPIMYATNPESLESQLMLLENLKEYICASLDVPGTFANFLISEGYGSNSIVGYLADKGTTDPRVVFDKLVEVFGRYLAKTR